MKVEGRAKKSVFISYDNISVGALWWVTKSTNLTNFHFISLPRRLLRSKNVCLILLVIDIAPGKFVDNSGQHFCLTHNLIRKYFTTNKFPTLDICNNDSSQHMAVLFFVIKHFFICLSKDIDGHCHISFILCNNKNNAQFLNIIRFLKPKVHH